MEPFQYASPSHYSEAGVRTFYVYIMTNRSGTLYIGMTNNLERRVSEHRGGLGSFTSRYRLVKLIYYEVTDGPYAAISREKEIKGWTREKKLALVRTENPAMKDLAPQLFGWRAGQFSVTRQHRHPDSAPVILTPHRHPDAGRICPRTALAVECRPGPRIALLLRRWALRAPFWVTG